MLLWHPGMDDPAQLQVFADAHAAAGSCLPGVVGHLDALVQRCCAPSTRLLDDLLFNGAKKYTAVKVQGLQLGNGLWGSLHMDLGSVNDSLQLGNSGILRRMEQAWRGTRDGGGDFYMVTDGGYALGRHVIKKYVQAANAAPLTLQQLLFNANLNRLRSGVERGFAAVNQQFALARFVPKLKLGLSPIMAYVLIGYLLRNLLTCARGVPPVQLPGAVHCVPPTMREYLELDRIVPL